MKRKPDFSLEEKKWSEGIGYIAGLDEVGRGSFAGPLVVGCVAFEKETRIPEGIHINDSKKLTPKRRKKAEAWIKENALFHSLGEASVEEINKKGIAKATHFAFRRAVNEIGAGESRIDYLFIDAYYIPYLRGFPKDKKQKAVENGDQRSLSIAAASIMAKEYRDRLMEELSEKASYKRYMWHKNKGYGTKEHRKALTRHGHTKHHRLEFIKSYIEED